MSPPLSLVSRLLAVPRLVWEVTLVGLRRLWHGKLELVLVFVVPVVFFTIFALIFTGGVGSGKTKRIKAAVENLDADPLAAMLIDRLVGDPSIRIVNARSDQATRDPYDRARDAILDGSAAVSLVVPEGWAESQPTSAPAKLFLLYDASDQVAPRLMASLVGRAAGEALAVRARARRVEARKTASDGTRAAPAPPLVAAPPAVESIDVLADGKSNPVVAMYAAGIAVMFLLFSATGSAGSLLEEEETQTLERLLASRVGMSHILVGKWLQLSIVGGLQIVVMFAWAQLVFGLDVLGRLGGFLMMTVVTVAAAGALALMLAAACRSRAQLNAVSVILVLTMSALGGSMVPRYLMSESMQEVGRVTFNAWAIDGYTKVFWRDLPIGSLWPELSVLAVSAAAMLLGARVLATRWEAV
ncbi:ABC transporter permease [Botrimarina sp.]|uniref:ABC transporter permease n=1 Tax=Botrimarina sp. TaxID=2795802 RepID=UPI0032EDD00C